MDKPKREITDEMRAKIEARQRNRVATPANRLATIADETLAILKTGSYEVSGKRVEFPQVCVEQTKTIVDASKLVDEALQCQPRHTPRIEITAEKTGDCAARLASQGRRVGLLNFANGVRVGGGFLQGSRAQEEDLCRCSALYPCLASKTAEEFYVTNEAAGTALVSDAMIVSPAVPFFRNDNYELLEKPFAATVITAAAPDQTWLAQRVACGEEPEVDENEVAQLFCKRTRNIIAAAYKEGVDALILGAWGCGAFGNDPWLVAQAFKRAIAEVGYCMPEIVFAIWSAGESNENLAAFQEVFSVSQPS